MNPSKSDFPVEAVNLVPTNKNGYLNRFVISISPNNENPNLAPAVVEDKRCEPPMAAPARSIPGPKLFWIFFGSNIFKVPKNYLNDLLSYSQNFFK